MNIHRAGKQQKAYSRAEERHSTKAAADPLLVVPKNTPYHFDCERRRSFATGWCAAVDFIRRQQRLAREAQKAP